MSHILKLTLFCLTSPSLLLRVGLAVDCSGSDGAPKTSCCANLNIFLVQIKKIPRIGFLLKEKFQKLIWLGFYVLKKFQFFLRLGLHGVTYTAVQ